MTRQKMFSIQVEETVRVSVTYSLIADSKEDALARFKVGDLGLHCREQDSDPEYVEVTHYDTAQVFDFT